MDMGDEIMILSPSCLRAALWAYGRVTDASARDIPANNSNSFYYFSLFLMTWTKVWKELRVFATKHGVAIACKNQLELSITWETIR